MNIFKVSKEHLIRDAQKLSQRDLCQKLNSLTETIGEENFRRQMAREIVQWIQPEQSIPDEYEDYKLLIRDGVEFFLSHVSLHRLSGLVVDQLKLEPGSEKESRLFVLAKAFPTLHKLGQIIARNRYLDPRVKRCLIQLENGSYGLSYDEIAEQIFSLLETDDQRASVILESTLLSEASVAALIRFHFDPDETEMRVNGAFKTLKPNIQKHLEEELCILEQMATFFNENRKRYTLRNFQFLHVFQDLRKSLNKETDLTAEQLYLTEAAQFWADMKEIHIPALLPHCHQTMTAMEYIEGCKITDAGLTREEKEYYAKLLFEALICRPLFAPTEPALYHGDPHAGNILITKDSRTQKRQIALVDWSLAGHLPQELRLKTVQLIHAVITHDQNRICSSVLSLVTDVAKQRQNFRENLLESVQTLMGAEHCNDLTLIKKSFWLLEQLAYEGIVFPSNLLMFRKAFFTLEGVLFELFPEFDMDVFVLTYFAHLVSKEASVRFGNFLFPAMDKPENYRSLLSNTDLYRLMFHQYTDTVRQNSLIMTALVEKQIDSLTDYCSRWGIC